MNEQDDEISKLMSIVTAPLAPGEKKPTELHEVDKFLFDRNIEPGEHKVSAYLVYHYYVEWLRVVGKKSQLTLRAFGVEMTKRFSNHKGRDKKGMFYMLNPNSFDLTRDLYTEYREKKREKDRKKNQGKMAWISKKIE